MNHLDCEDLLSASKALLEKSGLVCWDDQTFTFAAKYPGGGDSDFEKWWRKNVHHQFGRYIAWVLLSVGSENLVKAACVCNGVGPKPPDKLHAIGRYVGTHLPKLCTCRKIHGQRRRTLIDGYELLRLIRNRDVHDYRANKRRINFPCVEKQMIPAFNILLETMKTTHQSVTPGSTRPIAP